MKYLLLILFLIPVYLFGQSDTCFTKDEIIKIGLKIKNTENELQLTKAKIAVYENQTSVYDSQFNYYNTIFQLKDKQIEIYKAAINNIEQNKKWYEKPTVIYISGIVTGTIISVLTVKFAANILSSIK